MKCLSYWDTTSLFSSMVKPLLFQGKQLNCFKSDWWLVMDDVLHALIPSTVLLDITNIDKGTEGTLRKFADNIKLERAGNMLEGRAATQRNFNKLEEHAGRKDVMLKGQCKVLHLFKSPRGTVQTKLCLARKQLCRKGPGSLGGWHVKHWSEMWPCSRSLLGWVSPSVVSPSTETILPLYSVFVTPHVEYCVLF